MFNFAEAIKAVRVMTAQAAGATAVNGDSVDTKGFQGVAFVAEFGTITAGAVTALKAQQSSDDGDADAFADLTGTSVPIADDGDGGALILDVYRPRERFVRPVVVRGTQNAVIDGVMAYLYGPIDEPVTHDATVKGSECHQSPAEGTA